MTLKSSGVAAPDGSAYICLTDGSGNLVTSLAPSGAAGGVLGGTYPNPSFAATTGTGSVVLSASPTFTGTVSASDIAWTGSAHTVFTPTVVFVGGTGTSITNLASKYKLYGKLLVISTYFTINWTTAPTSLSLTLPSSLTSASYHTFNVLNLNTAATTWAYVPTNGTQVSMGTPAASGQSYIITGVVEVL